MTDLKRNLQSKIEELLVFFPVVLIVGARQTGKTTLAKKCRPDWAYYDLENSRDYERISGDFDFFFSENPKHIIFDEAQELPQLFKELRGVIDSDRQLKNRFILTGSSSPELLEEVSDSLAGRIGIVEVGTLKMNELQSRPLPEFYNIFSSVLDSNSLEHLKNQKIVQKTPTTNPDVLDILLRGGYPEPVIAQDEIFFNLWMENYFQTYINRDIKKLFPRLDGIKFRRFIRILSSLSGTIINKAAVARSLDINEVTVRDYLDMAHNTFIWRLIPSYEKAKIKSVTKMPKGVFRDSGLNHYLANIVSREQMLNSSTVGYDFESFVIEELIRGLQASDVTRWDYYYYRTRNGAEIDIILEGNFGVLPIEIKFGSHTQLRQLTSLRKFIAENKLPFGVVINNSNEIRLLCDSVIQIPVACI
jgi:predicted AAA+ superfamily ATPase